MSEFEQSEPQEARVALSGRDIELVQRECELQQATSPEQILGMTEALRQAKRAAVDGMLAGMDAAAVLAFDRELAAQIEPRNARGYRTTPVAFRDGGSSTAPGNLPEAMLKWAEAYAEGELSADELYRLYELHHPYEDGNGRAGWALWAAQSYRQTGQWPTELPPNMFGDNGEAPVQTESAFGAIERD